MSRFILSFVVSIGIVAGAINCARADLLSALLAFNKKTTRKTLHSNNKPYKPLELHKAEHTNLMHRTMELFGTHIMHSNRNQTEFFHKGHFKDYASLERYLKTLPGDELFYLLGVKAELEALSSADFTNVLEVAILKCAVKYSGVNHLNIYSISKQEFLDRLRKMHIRFKSHSVYDWWGEMIRVIAATPEATIKKVFTRGKTLFVGYAELKQR